MVRCRARPRHPWPLLTDLSGTLSRRRGPSGPGSHAPSDGSRVGVSRREALTGDHEAHSGGTRFIRSELDLAPHAASLAQYAARVDRPLGWGVGPDLAPLALPQEGGQL